MAMPTPTIIQGPFNSGVTTQTGGTNIPGMVMRLFADFQKYLDPVETPFTSSLKTGKAVNQKKVEWGQSHLMPHTSLLAAQANVGVSPINVGAAEAGKFQAGQTIRIGSETIWVTAVNYATGDLTVVRNVGEGGSGATHAISTVIEIMAPAAIENADTPQGGVAKGSLNWNYPQLMDTALQVSERDDNTPDYEFTGGSKYDAYLQKKMKEMAIYFEKTAILGRRGVEAAMTGVGATPTLMGGLDFFTEREYPIGGAAISEYWLQTVMYETWKLTDTSNKPARLLVGGFVRMALDSLWNSNRYADVKDDETNLTWRRVRTSFGEIEFVLSRYIPAGSAYLVDTSQITKHPYKGGEWKEVRLPSAGPYIKGRFTGDYTLVFRNPYTRAKITGISTNPADYPNL